MEGSRERTKRELPSTHPEIWGPPTWRALHLLAEGYPDRPTPPVRRRCAAFLEALPWMLPCEACGFHSRSFLKSYPGGSRKVASCRDALRCFLVELHNAVSSHTRPGRAPWSPAEAEAAYSVGRRGPLPHPEEWAGGSRLVRSEPSEGRDGKKEPDQCSCSAPPSPR